MKLKRLLKEITVKDVKGSKETVVTGLSSNSKFVSPGNLFVAKKGYTDNGANYIQEAILAGANTILTDMYDPSLKHITQIIDNNVPKIEGQLAAHYYQFPANELFMVGITGTNGKTTTSFLVKFLLEQLHLKSGLIGTIEYVIGNHRYLANRTTPDVISNQKMLRDMIMHDSNACVMEVTSHALEQNRVENIAFDIAIFTNLTLDHLDYHQNMENYAEAKRKLFSSLEAKTKKKNGIDPSAIINIDSPWSNKMIEDCKAKILTYGFSDTADLRAKDIKLSSKGSQFTICYKDQEILSEIPLVGRFNIYNCLAAVAVGLVRKEPLEKIVGILNTFPQVPGRLEPVINDKNLKVFVDFAHTDDALTNVLESLQEFKKNKLIVVFGCGGDRDKTKRPKMAKASESLADFCIVTSDNPRSENPEQICAEIVKGFSDKAKYCIEVDRKEAIKKAILMATEDDIVLIAGKGHETYQIFAHKTIEFDDRKVSSELITTLA